MTKYEIYTLVVDNFDLVPTTDNLTTTRFTPKLDLDCSAYGEACSHKCPLFSKEPGVSCILQPIKTVSVIHPFTDEEVATFELLRKASK